MRNFGNYAIDNCLAAMTDRVGKEEYDGIEITASKLGGAVIIEWLGYSFSCAYGRKAISVTTIGM